MKLKQIKKEKGKFLSTTWKYDVCVQRTEYNYIQFNNRKQVKHIDTKQCKIIIGYFGNKIMIKLRIF